MQIDPDELVDTAEAADLLGLDNPRSVSVLRKRHDTFPEPVIEKGRCILWRKADVEAWATETGRGPR